MEEERSNDFPISLAIGFLVPFPRQRLWHRRVIIFCANASNICLESLAHIPTYNEYTGCFKNNFTTLKAYVSLLRGYIQSTKFYVG
jgi:hypothetical protein